MDKPKPLNEIFIEAIKKKLPVSFFYQNTLRKACPHLLGATHDGRMVVQGFQYGGESGGKAVTPASGGWRFFYLDIINDQAAVILDREAGSWYPEQLKKSEEPYKAPAFIERVIEMVS